MVLGGFNFLENIREENDDELELEGEGSGWDKGRGALNAGHQSIDTDPSTTTAPAPLKCKSELATAGAERNTTSFESTEHTRCLSDASSHEEETHETCRDEAACVSLDTTLHLEIDCAVKHERHRGIRQGRHRHHRITSKFRFLERVGGTRYQEVQEEYVGNKAGLHVRSTTSPVRRKSFLREISKYWRRASTTVQPGLERNVSNKSIKTMTSVVRPRKKASGSFADAIGQEI